MNILNFKFKLPEAGQSLNTVFSDPKIYITLAIILALAALFIAVKKVKLNAKIITNIAMAVALGTVLKMFTIMKMPMGGSVTLGSMIPIILIAYIYGPRIGCLSGLLFGITDLLLGAYVVHPAQLIIDYIFAFSALGVAGFFKENITIGTLAAIGLRFLCHVVSGVIFFSQYANGENAIVYSIMYNGTYLLPEAIISVIVLKIIPIARVKKEIAKTV